MIALSVAKLKVFFAGKRLFPSNKAKKKFFEKSLDHFQRLRVRKKVRNVFVISLCLSDHKVLHNIASSSSFFDFARIFSHFSQAFGVHIQRALVE